MKPAWLKRKALLSTLGSDQSRWSRVVCYRECFAFLKGLATQDLDAIEISGGGPWQDAIPFRSFSHVHYPEYDVCEAALPRKYDVVIADQVWPHLLWPYRATRNVLDSLTESGWFVVTVPFLIHRNQPVDCTRWTETGLKHLLIEAGFPEDQIHTGSWGNLAAVEASLKRIGAKRGFGSLTKTTRATR